MEFRKGVKQQLHQSVSGPETVTGVHVGIGFPEILNDVFGIRGLGQFQEAVIVPFPPVVVILLGIHRRIEDIPYCGVSREIPVDSGDGHLIVPSYEFPDSGLVSEKPSCHAFGNDCGMWSLQGLAVTFDHVEAEHFGDSGGYVPVVQAVSLPYSVPFYLKELSPADGLHQA